MSRDWVKMRTELYRDPKVCVVADILMNKEGQLARYVTQNLQRDITVTRNVMRNVTVGALVSVWGVMRHRGKRIADDLLIKNCTVDVIDDVADLPGFGSAMEAVGWARQDSEGIVFPNFFVDYNVDPSEDSKAKNAERQRRYREKHHQNSNEKRNVTVTSISNVREEKRREENKEKEVTKVTSKKLDFSSWPQEPSEQILTDWFAMRKRIKADVSQTVINRFGTELRKAADKGISVDDCLSECVTRNWRGFEFTWIEKSDFVRKSQVDNWINED